MSIQKAPFYEYQLKDPFDETFILAGTLAWNKLYHEMLSDCLSLDKTKKFIILGDEQLKNCQIYGLCGKKNEQPK